MLLGLCLIETPEIYIGGHFLRDITPGITNEEPESNYTSKPYNNIIYNKMLNLSTDCKRVMFGKSKLAEVVATLTADVAPYDLTPVGSWRREEFTKSSAARPVHDLDFMTSTQLSLIAKSLQIKGWENIKPNRKKISFKYSGVPIDIFYCHKSQWAFGLLAHTGDAMLNKIMRRRAKDKFALKLNQYGFFYKISGRAHPINKRVKSEHDIFDFLGMEWREPRDRNYSRDDS